MTYSSYDEAQSKRAKARPRRLYLFTGNNFGPYAYTTAEEAVTKTVSIYGVNTSVTFNPWPIDCTDFEFTGTMDKQDIKVSFATGSGIENEYLGSPPETIVNLLIFDGDVNITAGQYVAVWRGRVLGKEDPDETPMLTLTASPITSMLRTNGLIRNYQLSCPLALYGPDCRATKTLVNRTAASFTRNLITLMAALPNPSTAFRSGTVQWAGTGGKTVIRTIIAVSEDGLVLTVRGSLRDLANGTSLSVVRGCAHNEADCGDIHNNIQNFGGQSFIPIENPLSMNPQFY